MRTVRAFDPMSSLSALARIDVSSVDRASFRVVEGAGRTLIHSQPRKRRWNEDELHLRSIVVDASRAVVSLGFPKFFNFGEHAPHDERFVAALDAGTVEFPEKFDGSLTVADLDERGEVSFRTRQSLTAGELGPLIDAVISTRYPRLREALAESPAMREGCSALFEFVHPDRTIVVRYERPALVLLALMDKRTLSPRWDEPTLGALARETGVDRAPVHTLPTEITALERALASWSNREGVVARSIDASGRPLLLKIKSESYLRLHAARSALSSSNARRVAFLLGAQDEGAFVRALEERGFDFESVTYARESVGDYFAHRERAARALDRLTAVFAGEGRATRAEKAAFVSRAREVIASEPALFVESIWFDVAVRLFEGRHEDARVIAYSALLSEPGPTVRQWLKDRESVLRAMLDRAGADDGEG